MKKSPLVVLFVTVFIDLIGFGIVLPLLPFYAEHFGANALLVGLLSTSFSLMQLLFAPVWGRLSDRVGRRPVILAGLLGSSISYLTFALAQSLPILFLSRILAGIAGANISTAQAYIADSTQPENRAKGMGLIGAAYGLGFTVGPAIGGILSQYGYASSGFLRICIGTWKFRSSLVAASGIAKSIATDSPDRIWVELAAARRPASSTLNLVFSSFCSLSLLLLLPIWRPPLP